MSRVTVHPLPTGAHALPAGYYYEIGPSFFTGGTRVTARRRGRRHDRTLVSRDVFPKDPKVTPEEAILEALDAVHEEVWEMVERDQLAVKLQRWWGRHGR